MKTVDFFSDGDVATTVLDFFIRCIGFPRLLPEFSVAARVHHSEGGFWLHTSNMTGLGSSCILAINKTYVSLFEKGPKYRLPSRIDFTKCRSIVEEALQSYCKRWCKKENVGVHALNDWNNEFLRIIDIRIENFTKHPHLYKQPTSHSVKSWKRKMEKLHSKYVFAPADKAANNVII